MYKRTLPWVSDQSEVRKIPSVLIIGAGVAGLTAAQCLSKYGVKTIIFEARSRPGGRCQTISLHGSGKRNINDAINQEFAADENKSSYNVDIGASSIYGTDFDDQIVYKMALRDKIDAPSVEGNESSESCTYSAWFDRCGNLIPSRTISKVHFKYLRIKGALARRKKDDGERFLKNISVQGGIESVYPFFQEENKKEQIILRKFIQRGLLDAGKPDEISLMRLEAHCDFPRKRKEKKEQRLSKEIDVSLMRNEVVPCPINEENYGDRILVNGYGPWLVRRLMKGMTIKYENVVRKVAGKTVADRSLIEVTTENGFESIYDAAIVTVPIGVLNCVGDNGIRFVPDISKEKREAFSSINNGVFNKLVLRFKPEDVFWPEFTPQLNVVSKISEGGYQFLNLNAYGKKGMIVCQIFGWTWKSIGMEKWADEEILCHVLGVMYKSFTKNDGDLWTRNLLSTGKMFDTNGKGLVKLPSPESWAISRWDSDPFSLGSYSILEPSKEYNSAMKRGEKLGTNDVVLWFAGEHVSLSFGQTVHGAVRSGIQSALKVLKKMRIDADLISLESYLITLDINKSNDELKKGRDGTKINFDRTNGVQATSERSVMGRLNTRVRKNQVQNVLLKQGSNKNSVNVGWEEKQTVRTMDQGKRYKNHSNQKQIFGDQMTIPKGSDSRNDECGLFIFKNSRSLDEFKRDNTQSLSTDESLVLDTLTYEDLGIMSHLGMSDVAKCNNLFSGTLSSLRKNTEMKLLGESQEKRSTVIFCGKEKEMDSEMKMAVQKQQLRSKKKEKLMSVYGSGVQKPGKSETWNREKAESRKSLRNRMRTLAQENTPEGENAKKWVKNYREKERIRRQRCRDKERDLRRRTSKEGQLPRS